MSLELLLAELAEAPHLAGAVCRAARALFDQAVDNPASATFGPALQVCSECPELTGVAGMGFVAVGRPATPGRGRRGGYRLARAATHQAVPEGSCGLTTGAASPP